MHESLNFEANPAACFSFTKMGPVSSSGRKGMRFHLAGVDQNEEGVPKESMSYHSDKCLIIRLTGVFEQII